MTRQLVLKQSINERLNRRFYSYWDLVRDVRRLPELQAQLIRLFHQHNPHINYKVGY